MKILSAASPDAAVARYSTRLVHQDSNARVVAFRLLGGQVVPEHRSGSTVILQVVEGQGVFSGDGGEVPLGPGGTIAYAPDEVHAIRADAGELHFLAIITPVPG